MKTPPPDPTEEKPRPGCTQDEATAKQNDVSFRHQSATTRPARQSEIDPEHEDRLCAAEKSLRPRKSTATRRVLDLLDQLDGRSRS